MGFYLGGIVNPIRTHQAIVVLYQHLDPEAHRHVTIQGSQIAAAARTFVANHPEITLKEARQLLKEADQLFLGATRLHRRARMSYGQEVGIPEPAEQALPTIKRRFLEKVFKTYREGCPEEVKAAEDHKRHLEYLVLFWQQVRTMLQG